MEDPVVGGRPHDATRTSMSSELLAARSRSGRRQRRKCTAFQDGIASQSRPANGGRCASTWKMAHGLHGGARPASALPAAGPARERVSRLPEVRGFARSPRIQAVIRVGAHGSTPSMGGPTQGPVGLATFAAKYAQ